MCHLYAFSPSGTVVLHVFKVHGNHSGNLAAQLNWIDQFIVLETRPQFIVLETSPRESPAQALGLDSEITRVHTRGGK
jgi:hypothetical protein